MSMLYTPPPTTYDRVNINDIYVETIIGFYHWEHDEPQPLHINLSLGHDFDQVFASGCLDDTIDYAQVTKDVKHIALHNKFHLMEELAHAFFQHILTTTQ